MGRAGKGLLTRPVPRFSASNDLKYDAERDLRDIEAPGIAVHALSKVGRRRHQLHTEAGECP